MPRIRTSNRNPDAEDRGRVQYSIRECLAVLLAAVAVGGCQLVQEKPLPEPEPPLVQGPPAPAETRTGPTRLVDAMDHLQYGRFEQAAAMIETLREASPGSPTLALLARQLEAPPEDLLPGPYRTLEVQPGDTLSQIAVRELGNPLLFVALARLNGIDVPRTLAIGTELRVPDAPQEAAAGPAAVAEAAGETGEGPDSPSTAADGGAVRSEAAEPGIADVPAVASRDAGEPQSAAPTEPRRSELETVAEYLLASGQPTDARELLLAAAQERHLSPRAEGLLVELALDTAQAESDAGQFDDAVATLAQVSDALDPGASQARIDVRRTRIEVQSLLRRAEGFRERDLLFEAYALAEEARSLEPGYAPAVSLQEALREELVERHHDRALRAWRARDIDVAIRAWRELLEVVPDFEPARVYLDRAERLRTRLGEPD
ncbi:LysM peptidoglycan-binding domain-containing protein [Halomonas denitrificans]|nr:LysM peptidoglycan-binding domain-containing protein [Halomonas denitrificans]